MKKLSTDDRAAAMTEGVSFHDVPMPRGLAFGISHIESHGAPVSIFSADRTVAAITAHNKEFGTTLHAQQYLFDNQGKPGFNPANPPTRTSHCLQEHKGTGHFSRWQDPVVLARDRSLQQAQGRARQLVPAGRTLARLRIRPAVHVRCGEASCDQRQEPDRDARALERDLLEPDRMTGTRLPRSAGAGDMVGSR